MRFNHAQKMLLVAMAIIVAGFFTMPGAHAQMMKMKKPNMVTISGKVIDLTCAAKGHAMTGMWMNTKNDHMRPQGKQKQCATMCLKGGQPAALFAGGKITATFACNPRATLADYAAQEVDVMGFWSGPAQGAFVPMKIRAKGSSAWKAVDCATMHQ